MVGFKKIALIFVIFVSMLSTGCWNYREIEKLAIVAGVSVDKNLSKGTYEVSVEIINPTSSKSQTKITSQLYSSQGKTVIVIYIWFCFHLSVLILRNFSEFTNIVIFPDTPVILPTAFL